MKRSEMVDIMYKNISEVLFTTIEFNKKDCEKLLDLMESHGILPPSNNNNSVAADFIEFHKWEPEDEEK